MTSSISPDETLAWGEQKKILALLNEGYELFRAIAWNSSCDLIALKGDEVLRIQIRGTASPARTHEHDQPNRVTHSNARAEYAYVDLPLSPS
jgi:hypothetical protein